RHALEELAVLTGTVRVQAPTDAEIEIDGAPIGKVPLSSPKRLKLGDHKLRVTKSGFEPFETTLTIRSEEVRSVAVDLRPQATTGHVSVRERDDQSVHVFVDGEDQGAAPWNGELAAGEHVIEAKAGALVSERRSLRVKPKEHIEIVLDAIATTGRLHVSTS